MKRKDDGERTESRLKPEGVFVVQLRSDSDLSNHRLRGRVEHVMSGQSVRFASLRDLIAFMNRYATVVTALPSTTGMKKKEEDLDDQ